MGPVNLPSSVAVHDSQAFDRNILDLLQHLMKGGGMLLDPAGETTGARVGGASGGAVIGIGLGMRDYFIQGSYLAASVLFILGLRGLTRPDKARRGMQLAAAGMLFAIVGTLVSHQIVDYRWIAAGLVL